MFETVQQSTKLTKQQLQLVQQSSMVKVCVCVCGLGGGGTHSEGRSSWHWESPSESCDWIVFMRLTFCGLLKRLSRASLVRMAELRRTCYILLRISQTESGFLHIHYRGIAEGEEGVNLIEILRFWQRWLWNVLRRDALYSGINYSTFRRNVLIPSVMPNSKPSARQVQWFL
jgi:hypothetical protein